MCVYTCMLRCPLSLQCTTVQWYPGHIAKAERQLKEQLKMVDLVLEVRDARIPFSTCHPQVGEKTCHFVRTLR
jgi:ribosome biogenesis GTPase A